MGEAESLAYSMHDYTGPDASGIPRTGEALPQEKCLATASVRFFTCSLMQIFFT